MDEFCLYVAEDDLESVRAVLATNPTFDYRSVMLNIHSPEMLRLLKAYIQPYLEEFVENLIYQQDLDLLEELNFDTNNFLIIALDTGNSEMIAWFLDRSSIDFSDFYKFYTQDRIRSMNPIMLEELIRHVGFIVVKHYLESNRTEELVLLSPPHLKVQMKDQRMFVATQVLRHPRFRHLLMNPEILHDFSRLPFINVLKQKLLDLHPDADMMIEDAIQNPKSLKARALRSTLKQITETIDIPSF